MTNLVLTDIAASLEHSDISVILQFPDRLVYFAKQVLAHGTYVHIVYTDTIARATD
jgi:hypothetical protein